MSTAVHAGTGFTYYMSFTITFSTVYVRVRTAIMDFTCVLVFVDDRSDQTNKPFEDRDRNADVKLNMLGKDYLWYRVVELYEFEHDFTCTFAHST